MFKGAILPVAPTTGYQSALPLPFCPICQTVRMPSDWEFNNLKADINEKGVSNESQNILTSQVFSALNFEKKLVRKIDER